MPVSGLPPPQASGCSVSALPFWALVVWKPTLAQKRTVSPGGCAPPASAPCPGPCHRDLVSGHVLFGTGFVIAVAFLSWGLCSALVDSLTSAGVSSLWFLGSCAPRLLLASGALLPLSTSLRTGSVHACACVRMRVYVHARVCTSVRVRV